MVHIAIVVCQNLAVQPHLEISTFRLIRRGAANTRRNAKNVRACVRARTHASDPASQYLAVGECSTRKTCPSSPTGQSCLARHTPSWNRNCGSGDGSPTACTFGGHEHVLANRKTKNTRCHCHLPPPSRESLNMENIINKTSFPKKVSIPSLSPLSPSLPIEESSCASPDRVPGARLGCPFKRRYLDDLGYDRV